VSEPWRSRDITNGIDVRDGCLVALVDLDVATISEGGLNTAGENGGNSNRDKSGVGCEDGAALSIFDGDFNVSAFILGFGDLGLGKAFDTLLGE